MIKKLFLLIFMLIVLLILSPVILLGLMYQGDLESALPISAYEVGLTPAQTLSEDIDATLDQLLTPDEDVLFSLSEKTLNSLIFASLTQDEGLNPSYAPSTECETDACQYLITEEITADIFGRLNGIWLELDDDQVTVSIGASLEWQDRFTYGTILSLTFDVIDEVDRYQLRIDQIRLGRLPITSRFLGRVLSWIENATGEPVLEVQNNLPVGTLDLETFSYTLFKSEIVTLVKENEELENRALAAQLLEIVFEKEIITFKIEEEAFNFSFRSSLFLSDEDTSMPPSVALLYEASSPVDLDSYLQGRFEEFILTQALLGETSFRLNERFFNTIIASGLSGEQGLPDLSYEYQDKDGNPEIIELKVEGVWVTLTSDVFTIKALFNLASKPSLMEFVLTKIPSNNPFEIIYEIETLSIGKSLTNPSKEDLTIDDFSALIPFLKSFIENEFIQFNESDQLVIGGASLETYINTFLQGSGIQLSGIRVQDQAMVLDLQLDPALQTIFDNYANAINEVLTNDELIDALNSALNAANNEEAVEVINQLNLLSDKLGNNEPLTEEEVSAFIDAFDELTTDDQTAFFITIQGFIDPSLIEEFENSFNE
jgi:hypothetical protein